MSAHLELFPDKCLPCTSQPRPRRLTPVLYYGRAVVIPSSFNTYTLLWSCSGHSFIITTRPVLYYGRAVVIPSSLQHDLYFIMVAKWSFFHHYSTNCTLLWSYNGHSLIISHLYFIMVVQWSFPHHFTPTLYYGRAMVIPSSFHTCTLLWSYNGRSLFISHLYFIMVVQRSFPHYSSTIYYKLTTTAVSMVLSVHMPYRGLFSLRNQS